MRTGLKTGLLAQVTSPILLQMVVAIALGIGTSTTAQALTNSQYQPEVINSPEAFQLSQNSLTPQTLPETEPLKPYLLEHNPYQNLLPQQNPITQPPSVLPSLTPPPWQSNSGNQPTSALPNNLNRNIPDDAALDEQYRLGAGDTVRLEFLNVSDYNGDYLISTDGKVTLPLVGRISLANLTVREAGDRLAAMYGKELRYPKVSVSLIARRPVTVVMTGEIIKPGLYVFPSNVQGQPPKLYQALQTAGGITQAGDLQKIQIVRENLNPSLSHTVNVDLVALLQRGDIRQNVELRDGDVIVIPPATNINVNNIQQLVSSNVGSQSAQPIDIVILGEVEVPGPYRFSPSDMTKMIQAIQGAGGLSPFANIREVALERRSRDGSIQKMKVDLFAILDTGRLDQDIPLQDGDVITIPATELSNDDVSVIASSTLSSGPINIAILGEVQQPGNFQLEPNTSLNQALLAAGGFNGLARDEVKLLRFNADGSVTEREIAVDLTRTVNPENNPLLRSNDIIMVGKSTWGSIKDTLNSISSNLNFFLPFLFFNR
jgi:polysaccharide export outer membrane protein